MRGRPIGMITVLLVMLCGAAGALAGCGGESSASMSASSPAGGAAAHAGAAVSGGAAGSAGAAPLAASGATAGSPPSAADVAVKEQPVQLPTAVIKTAEATIRVGHGHLHHAVTQADVIAGRAGGYVSQSSLNGGRAPDALVVIRVPAARFERTLAALEQLGRERSETVTGQDVTQEYVNLNARLVNLRAQQQVMRRLMARAQTIFQSIQVQNQLSRVELQIEELTGQLLYLRNRTALSTITLRLTEAVPPPPPASHPSALWKAGQRSLDAGLAVLTAVIVGAGFVIPLAVIAGVLVLAGRKLLPWTRRTLPDPEQTA
jgi:Domain of unknown function (DUF4349)